MPARPRANTTSARVARIPAAQRDLRHHVGGLDQSGKFAIIEGGKGCDNRAQVGAHF
jgi:hypothetical protein